MEQEIENAQGEDIMDSLISDVKKAAGSFRNVIEDVSIKKFMNDYFEAVREGVSTELETTVRKNTGI